MDFEVNVDERADAYSVVAVRGEIDLHTAPKVQYAIERAAGPFTDNNGGASGGTDGGTHSVGAVIVDVSGVAFMDSTALSTLVRSKDVLEKQGISLRLAALSGAVKRIFSVTGFDDYFEVFPSRDAAVFD